MPSEAKTAPGHPAGAAAPARGRPEIEVIDVPPVFLVGERAGRLRLARLLDGQDGISCAPETALLADLAAATRRNWPALGHYGYPEQYWLKRVADFFGALQLEYAAGRGLTRWAATAAPDDLALVDRLFPRCKVVRIVASPARAGRRAAPSPEAEFHSWLSNRYYLLPVADLMSRADQTLRAVLDFADPLVEAPRRS